MEKAMKVKIALSLIFLIALSAVGINCGSSKADKITGPSTSGSPSYQGNALDITSSKSKIGVGETATITTTIYNTGTYTDPDGNLTTALRGDKGKYQCNTTGTDTTISVAYTINTYGTISATSSSATIKGSTSTTCTESWTTYYFTITLTSVKTGTVAITATRFDMQKTIYVDVE
ncbi:MAG: hypothetical protein HY279_09325 [Nitrospinae bacterium]|nr:hypothetical protein [Nitrospinota bacterium]